MRAGPDTAPAATVEACIAICKELFHPAPDRKTSCGAAAWNGPSKQCYLKTHKAKPVRAPALNLPAEPDFHSCTSWQGLFLRLAADDGLRGCWWLRADGEEGGHLFRAGLRGKALWGGACVWKCKGSALCRLAHDIFTPQELIGGPR